MHATDRRLDKLIRLLVAHTTVVVPGPKIAEEIGVSRSTVWEWVERLRELGVNIKGHPASGYQLERLPDLLAPSLVRPELVDCELVRKVVHYFRTGSTNDDALRLASEGATHGTLVLAEEQTAGRGRFGRAWYSEKSAGIYSSLILRPPLPPSAAPILTLMAGIAIHRTITLTTGLAADIRWPNDVLVNGKKLSGVLTEMSAEVDRLHAVILGIGINVNHRIMPAELASTATSLRMEAGRSFSRVQVLAAFLKEIERYYHLLLEKGNAPIVTDWSAASSYAQGKRIHVVTRTGEFFATTVCLEPSGALRVRRESGEEEPLIAGEIAEVK